MGIATGDTTQKYLTTATISATPNYGYHFTRWNDGDTNNPRTIIVNSNKTYTAQFGYNTYTITATSQNDVFGSVSGAGSYNYLNNCSITATSNYGYHFAQWNDGDTNNPRSITLTQDTAFVAQFVANQYNLAVSTNNATWGSVMGGGTFNYLDTAIVTATPSAHYHLVRWSDGSRENPHSVIIRNDSSITAFFAIDTFAISATSNDIARGSVTGGGTFTYGETVTLTATAYSGYIFGGWSNGMTYNPYTFAALADMDLVANFIEESSLQYLVTVTSVQHIQKSRLARTACAHNADKAS